MAQEHSDNDNLYFILGAKPSSDAAEIRSKYRQAALRLHPDKGGSPSAFHKLTFAFEVLSCSVARAVYDKSIKKKMSQQNSSRNQIHCIRKSTENRAPSLGNPKSSFTAHASQHFPDTHGSKRKEVPSEAAEPPSKRVHANQNCKIDTPSLRELMGALREVLRSMKPEQRREALQKLPPHLQSALVVFMETWPKPQAAVPSSAAEPSMDPSSLKASDLCATCGITTTAGLRKASATYSAHMHVKALRFYTRGHGELAVALERQMVLAQLRQALFSASLQNLAFWKDVAETNRICSEVFTDNNTSEADMGLSAFVYMRAGHWLPQTCTIISPIMPLAEVLDLHRRLLHARETSWQMLRAEWVQLMQSARHSTAKCKSLCEAEAIADSARAIALKTQFARVAISAAKALDVFEHRASKQRKTLMRQRACKTKCKAVAERRAAKAQGDMWKARRLWWRRADLTMNEIMHGPHVQNGR